MARTKFVFDATPLIHLAKSGLAPLLTGLRGEKFTVTAVVKEVVGEVGNPHPGHPDAAIVASLIEGGSVVVKSPSPETVDALVRLHRDVHPGEAEALALARELGAVAVVDDRVARAVAKMQGIRVEGTYGVVFRAAKEGTISPKGAEDSLDRLLTSGWRCDAELYAALLKSIRELRR